MVSRIAVAKRAVSWFFIKLAAFLNDLAVSLFGTFISKISSSLFSFVALPLLALCVIGLVIVGLLAFIGFSP